MTNNDRMLRTILSDESLIKYGQYNPDDYSNLEKALCADNPIVVAVAKIIHGLRNGTTEKEIYNELNNYLSKNLI